MKGPLLTNGRYYIAIFNTKGIQQNNKIEILGYDKKNNDIVN